MLEPLLLHRPLQFRRDSMTAKNLGARADGKFPDQNDLKYQRIGYFIIGVVFLGFGGWSALAPLGSAAPASGMVVVQSERRTLQHLEGGILDQLLVREGDQVKEGQLLARLDVVQTQANLDVLTAQMLVVEAQIHRLKSERARATSIQWPQVLNEANEPRIIDVLAEQEALFQKRKDALSGEVLILSQRADQLRSRIKGLRESKETKKLLLESVKDEYENLSQLLNEGFVDETRVRDFERRIVELRGDLQSVDSEIQSAEIQIGEADLQILQARSVFDREVQSQLTDLQGRRDELREQMRVAEDRLDRASIVAPVDGIVLTIDVTTEGGVVPGGQPFITVVPEEDELLIEAQVAPVDVDRIRAGQSAELQFSSFDQNSMPKIFGEVLTVSADALTDRNSGATYYLATLAIPNSERTKLSGYKLVPGMPVNVLIQTGERTLWQYLTNPLAKGMSHALIED